MNKNDIRLLTSNNLFITYYMLNRLRISPIGNSLLILVGNDFSSFKSIPTKINKEFPIETIRSRLNLDFGKRDIFKHGDKL